MRHHSASSINCSIDDTTQKGSTFEELQTLQETDEGHETNDNPCFVPILVPQPKEHSSLLEAELAKVLPTSQIKWTKYPHAIV